jgi:hypothetical protein
MLTLNPQRTALAALLCTLLLGVSSAQAQQQSAQDVERLRAAMVLLLKTLVDQNVITAAKAQETLRQAGVDPALLTAAAPPAPPAPSASPAAPSTAVAIATPPVVRVPYVPESVKQEMREQLRQEIAAQAKAEGWGNPGTLPSWLSRISLNGDVRVRLQRDDYPDDNALPQVIDGFYQLPPDATRNTSEDRARFRVRARLGVQARVTTDVEAGLRLVTSSGGDANNPVSTNVDLGRFNRRLGVAFDQAYLGWTRDDLSVRGGRIANPYLTSDLMWAPDLTFDGISASYSPAFNLNWQGFATVGLHPLQEVAASPTNQAQDKWLLGLQVGARWTSNGGSQARLGAALYDFNRIEGELNPSDPPSNALNSESAPGVRQRGNTMFNITALSNPSGNPVWGIASKFRVVNLTAGAELGWLDPWRLGINIDWLRNIGFDRDDIAARLGSAVNTLPQDKTGANGLDRRRTDGLRFEFSLAHGPRDQTGSWQVFAGHRMLQRDAVPDAFTSADYRLGGTDQKASFLGGQYTWARNTSFSARYIDAQSLDSPAPYRVNAWLLDFNTRF